MKRRFTILTAALALLVTFAIPMGMWGQTRTEEVYSTCLFGPDYNSTSVGSYTATWTTTNGDFTWTIVNGNNNNNGWNYVKFGRKNTASVGQITTAAAYEQAITKVDLTIDAITVNSVNSITLYSSTDSDTWTEVGSFAKSTGLQTVTVANPAVDQYYMIEFECASGSSNGLVTVSKVEYYYNTSGASSPTISADNVSIEYDATSGSIAYVINNGVEDGVLSAEVSSNSTIEEFELDPVGASPITFSCLANETTSERTATVTLTYTYGDDQTVSKNVIVTQAAAPAPALPNIAALTALTDAGDYAVTLTDAVVTYNNGNYAYIQDASGAVVYYKNGHGLTAGDVLNGTATVTYQLRNSNPQITNLTDVTPVSGTAPEPTEVASSAWDYTFGNVLSQYFKVTGATITQNGSKYYVSLGGEDIQLYKASGAISGLNLDKTYSITGFPTMYNTTKELQIFDNPVEEASTEPSITIAPATVEVDAEEHDGTLDLAYDNLEISDMTDFDIQYYDAEGEETETPDWIEVLVAEQDPEIGEGYVVSYNMFENEGEARSAYFKVFAVGDEDFVYSNLVTINQAEYVVPALDYAELPFEFDGGRADIENTDGLTQEGLDTDYSSSPKLKFNTTGDWLLLHFNEQPGTLTFDIKGNGFSGGTFTVQTSEDGETYTDLKTYTELGDTQHESFTNLGENVRYIKWIYTQKVSGNVALGNIALAEYVAPQEYTLTVEPFENLELITFVNDEMVMEGDGEIQVTNGNQIMLSIVAMEGYVMETLMVNGVNHVNDIADDFTYTFEMPAENVTISATAVEVVPVTGDEYALYTGELVEGDYLIVYDGGAMNTTVEGDRLQYEEVVATNDVIITDNVEIIWHIASSGDYWTIYNADADAFAAGTGVKNKAQMLADGTDDKALWTVSGTETYEFVNKANTAAGVNANLRKNGIYGFACYSTSTGDALSLYKKVEATTETYTLEIDGYAEGSVGGYYLIASPVTVDLTNHDMTTGDFDLYYFDNAQDDEWRNYRQGAFNLEPGTGYLYAKKKATDDNPTYSFELTGVPYNGNGDVELTYTENADFAGYNLIGNPLNTNAALDMPYYRLNSDGSALNTSTETSQINVMEGVFVQATAENTTAHFTTAAGSKIISQLNVKVTRNRGAVLDNAIIRFDNGAMLGKFQLNPNSTKVYITEGNEDYAIVRSAAESEMPVSFKAAENGTYTLSVVAENVEMNYLHLIDNMTGTDVDLLATPSYSFEANTTDYANRFRLVFNANGLEENSNFAFFNGSEWVVSNMGDATLQVIDMTGRVISSETVNGNVTLSTNGLTAGVYMMRLVNGNDVKTQKVLVK